MGKLFCYALLALGILVFLLFFPIVITTDAHLDINNKKLAFSVYFYRLFKLIGGYIEPYSGGLALHISKKKAILLPYAQMNNERKRFSFLKTFRLSSFTLTTETGVEYLFPVALGHVILRTYFFARGGKKEKSENNLWLTDGDVLRISASIGLSFNLYILLRNFIIFLKEKMKILWQKKTTN